MTDIGREAAIDIVDEQRSAKHQWCPNTGLSGSLAEAVANNIPSKSPLHSSENSNFAMHCKSRPAKDLLLFLAYKKSTVKLMTRHKPHKMRIDGTGRPRWQPEVFECCPLPERHKQSSIWVGDEKFNKIPHRWSQF